jgi:hypothetical protein
VEHRVERRRRLPGVAAAGVRLAADAAEPGPVPVAFRPAAPEPRVRLRAVRGVAPGAPADGRQLARADRCRRVGGDVGPGRRAYRRVSRATGLSRSRPVGMWAMLRRPSGRRSDPHRALGRGTPRTGLRRARHRGSFECGRHEPGRAGAGGVVGVRGRCAPSGDAAPCRFPGGSRASDRPAPQRPSRAPSAPSDSFGRGRARLARRRAADRPLARAVPLDRCERHPASGPGRGPHLERSAVSRRTRPGTDHRTCGSGGAARSLLRCRVRQPGGGSRSDRGMPTRGDVGLL